MLDQKSTCAFSVVEWHDYCIYLKVIIYSVVRIRCVKCTHRTRTQQKLNKQMFVPECRLVLGPKILIPLDVKASEKSRQKPEEV